MRPVSPVLPGSAEIEIVLGKDQPQYLPLPAVCLGSETRPMITRFRLDDTERAKIAAGADIVLQQLTFGAPFQPINLQICGEHEFPDFLEVLSEADRG